jgi:hypothetical protein
MLDEAQRHREIQLRAQLEQQLRAHPGRHEAESEEGGDTAH